MGRHWVDGYSAEVDAYLLIEGKKVQVSNVGDNAVILRDERLLPGQTTAELVVIVDGVEETSSVFFPHGGGGPGFKPIVFY